VTKVKKILPVATITFTIIVAGLLVVVVFLYLSGQEIFPLGKRRPEAPARKTSPALAEKTFTAKQIATASIGFLDQQKRPDGFYNFIAHFEERCADSKSASLCSKGARNVVEAANMWAVLGRVAYYKNFSRDPRLLSQAEADAHTLMAYCRRDMSKCSAVAFPFAELYKETKNDKYLVFLQDLGEMLLEKDLGRGIVQLSGMQSRSLARLYEIFSDQRYLAIARRRLLEAQKRSREEVEKYNAPDDESCYLVLAQMEIGRVSGDTEMLEKAVAFFSKGRDADVPDDLTLIQPCIESAYLLGQSLNNPQLKNRAKQLLEQYVVERWDGPDLGRAYGEGGFAMSKDPTLINVTDTGYMLYLLGLDPDLDFTFKGGKIGAARTGVKKEASASASASASAEASALAGVNWLEFRDQASGLAFKYPDWFTVKKAVFNDEEHFVLVDTDNRAFLDISLTGKGLDAAKRVYPDLVFSRLASERWTAYRGSRSLKGEEDFRLDVLESDKGLNVWAEADLGEFKKIRLGFRADEKDKRGLLGRLAGMVVESIEERRGRR
jgi:hypothetical protein